MTRAPSSYASIPQIPKRPLLGNIGAFRAQRLQLLDAVVAQCGDIGMFHVGPWPVVLVNAPSAIKTVLVEQAASFEKSNLLRRHLRPILGTGLLTADNAPHARQRQLIAPAFQPARVQAYSDTMGAVTEDAATGWQAGQIVDVWDAMMRLTLRIAGHTLLGVDLDDQAAAIGTAVTTFAHVANTMANTIVRVPQWWPTPTNRRMRQALHAFDTVIRERVAQRVATPGPEQDVLSLLLHAQHDTGMTDVQLRDEVATLLIAGHETMASALSWTWYLLLQHPEIYARARREACAALQGRTPTAHDLPQVPYIRQVVQESMRLYPPAWVILRQAVRPVEIGPYRLPPGMRVAISPYTLHRRPDLFPDPMRFDPDRFAPAHEQTRPRYAYVPFGAGPRSCIGRMFAEMEGHIILATLLQRVVFEQLAPALIEPEPLTTLRLTQPLLVRVQHRA